MKDRKVVVFTMSTKMCYREKKFNPGDPRRDCQFGLDALDLKRCPDCRWYDDMPGSSNSKMYSDDDSVKKVAAFLPTLSGG